MNSNELMKIIKFLSFLIVNQGENVRLRIWLQSITLQTEAG